MQKWLNQSSLIRLIPFIVPYRLQLCLVGLMLVLIAFFTALPPWLIQYAIDVVMPGNDPSWLLWLGAAILFLSLAEGLLSFFQQVFSEWISQKIILDIRNHLFHHLNQLSFSFFDRTRVGDLLSRVVSDADTLKRFLGFGLLKVVTNLLVLLWILVSLTLWSPWMGLLFITMLPFMFHAMWAYSHQVRPAFRRIRKTTGDLTAFTREYLSGINIVKLTGNEAWAETAFKKENNAILEDTLTANKISAFWLPYSEVLLGFFAGLILVFGGWLITTGRITAGSLVGLLAYVNLLNRPIRQTGFLLSLFQQGDTAAARIVELLEHQNASPDAPNAVPFSTLQHSFTMDDVSFSYDNQPVLLHVTLEALKGETLAIVGPSGAGKTTLVHLLLRFYEPDSGGVFLDGQPLNHYTTESLRHNIGFVMQHPFLFGGTIRENITLGSPKATEAEIREAASNARLHNYIQTLPKGYDTIIGERGVRLSGGQAQRLALARVLLRKPEILVLDEPTSSVDAITDNTIMDAIAQQMAGKTVLVIAHRLATLHNADRILFLSQGRVTGIGTHHELMAENPAYRQFFEASGYTLDEGGT